MPRGGTKPAKELFGDSDEEVLARAKGKTREELLQWRGKVSLYDDYTVAMWAVSNDFYQSLEQCLMVGGPELLLARHSKDGHALHTAIGHSLPVAKLMVAAAASHGVQQQLLGDEQQPSRYGTVQEAAKTYEKAMGRTATTQFLSQGCAELLADAEVFELQAKLSLEHILTCEHSVDDGVVRCTNLAGEEVATLAIPSGQDAFGPWLRSALAASVTGKLRLVKTDGELLN